MDYILIVPARNEEQRLPLMMKSIINQTVTPKICVIVDDGSTDNTPKIINALEENFTWIYHRTLPPRATETWGFSWDGGTHFAQVVSEGVKYAQEICNSQSIIYEYIAKVDADFVLPKSYFEELISRFQSEPRLGIASGDAYYAEIKDGVIDASNITHKSVLADVPSDGARLYRKACLDAIGGILVSYGSDSVALAKARLLNWGTKRFGEIRAFATRKSVGGGHAWRGYKFAGYEAYCLDYHPFLVLLRAGSHLLERPHYHAFAWLYGYSLGLLHRRRKIEDEQVRFYFRHQRLAELRRNAFSSIKGVFQKRTGE